MSKNHIILLFCVILMPSITIAAEILSFDIDQVYYEDDYRIFDFDFSQGEEDTNTGSLDLYDAWTSKTNNGTNPGMNFHPSDGSAAFFNLDTTNGWYQVSLPKPFDCLPVLTASDSPSWHSISKYIDEGTGIDYRGGNASANIEYIKLAYNSDKSQMKIYFKVTEETDLSNIGFRFVFFPIENRGSYGFWSYMEDNYPMGAPKFLIVDLDNIAANSGTVKQSIIADGNVKTEIADALASCTRNRDNLEVTFSITHNDETVIDLSSDEFLMRGVSFSDPGGTPKMQDQFGPWFLRTEAGGELTTSSLSFDSQDTSTEYIFATRLRNFSAFSTDRMDEFTVGMYGNAVADYNDAPMVSITGKWVQGFHDGKKYDGSFLFSNRIFDMENSVEGSCLTDEDVEVSDVSPDATIIDIAMQTAENGYKMNMYYRISASESGPSDISNIDSSWTLFNTCTLTSKRPFYGYKVNKGVVFIRSDAISYPVEMSNWGNEGNNAEIVGTDMDSKSADELTNEFKLADFQPIAPKEQVEVTCNPGEKVILRYLINGFHKELNRLRLYKLKNGNHLKFKNYVQTPNLSTIKSGDWWITEHGAKPDKTVGKLGFLKKDTRYVLYFVIKDNHFDYDLDETEGRILDPTVIGEYSGPPEEDYPWELFYPIFLNKK